MRPTLSLLVSLLLCSLGGLSHADEGQWTPDQIGALDLPSRGLALTAEALWQGEGDERSGGLMRAVVNYGGCTAAFISDQGLMATNHHCAYGALQSNSTPENDYLQHGFLAAQRSDELPAKGRSVLVLRQVTDVTDKIRAPADAAASDSERARVIKRLQKELVQTCEAADAEALRCAVRSFYNGSQYRLFQYLHIRDVRIAYAPPTAIGEYGGDIDNWMWPRHTGDFTLLRAYVNAEGKPADHAESNVPYRPGQHLKVSTEGVSPGDFIAILGYPGTTKRYLSAAEIQRHIEQVLPHKIATHGEWLDILAAAGKRDPAVAIKVAALHKRLANRHKNARGMLGGIDHMKLLARRRAEEKELRAWAADKPEFSAVLDEMTAASARARSRHERAMLLRDLALGPNALALGIDLVRKVRAAAKPDIERPERYQQRQWKRLWSKQQRRMRDFDAGVDAELLASVLARTARTSEEGQRIAPLMKLARQAKAPGQTTAAPERSHFAALARRTIDGSRLSDPAFVEPLWQLSDPAALAKVDDPLLSLASAIVDVIETVEAEDLAVTGAAARLLPRYYEMLKQARPGPVYPDANGTLRISHATIQGYDKWDGATQKPQTTLAGAVAKHTGETPFALPQAVRDHAASAPASAWADSDLGDLGLCFLSNGDTTGGNSGSPVIDGKGQLVGLNFDRVWENIAGDFSYYQGHSRNVSVDVRYLLWLLDQVVDGQHLLRELQLARAPKVENMAGGNNPTQAVPGTATERSPEREKSGCGCSGAGQSGPGGLLLVFLGIWLRPRRNPGLEKLAV